MYNVTLNVIFKSGIEKSYYLKVEDNIKSKEELENAIKQLEDYIQKVFEKDLRGYHKITTTNDAKIIIRIDDIAAIEIYIRM